MIPFSYLDCTKSKRVSYAVQTVVVDARAHMLGRLSSVVAKQLLSGQQIVSCLCQVLYLLIKTVMKTSELLYRRIQQQMVWWGLAEALVPHRCLCGVRK